MNKVAAGMFVALAVSFGAQAEIIIRDNDTIAFMGDSITEQGNRPTGYVNLVMKGLEIAGVRNVQKIPVGISGHKSDNMLARLDKDVLARTDKKTAQWMTFSCGVNDVWHGARGVPFDGFTNNVTKIFDSCEKAGVKVIVLTPTMIYGDPNSDLNKKLAPYVSWLREESVRRKLACADLNAIMQEAIKTAGKEPGENLTSDGVHMAFMGNVMMAWGVLEAMGVPQAKMAEILKAWYEMPGAFELKLSLSFRERQELNRRLKSEKTDEATYLKGRLGFK